MNTKALDNAESACLDNSVPTLSTFLLWEQAVSLLLVGEMEARALHLAAHQDSSARTPSCRPISY